MARSLLHVEHLSKRFCRHPRIGNRYAVHDIFGDLTLRASRNSLRQGEFWALNDVNFTVGRGEVVGLIGHNGAGKTTLLNLIAGLLRPTTGTVSLDTKQVVSLSHNVGLDPVQSGRENIRNQLSLFGMNRQSICLHEPEVIRFAELENAIDAPVGTYSLGMKLRLMFAIYSRLRPDLLLLDEALNGGDLRFRNKFQQHLEEYVASGGSVVLASHDLFAVQMMCNRCVLLDQGQVIAVGKPVDVIDLYQRTVQSSEDTRGATAGDVTSLLGKPVDPANSRDLVQVESVEITAAEGGTLRPGGPASARIVCHSKQSLAHISCSIIILVNDAVRLISVTTILPELSEGRNVLHCSIESLPLIPAKYLVKVVFMNQSGSTVLGMKGHFDQPGQFEIEGPSTVMTTMRRYHNAFVHVSATWSSEKTPTESQPS